MTSCKSDKEEIKTIEKPTNLNSFRNLDTCVKDTFIGFNIDSFLLKITNQKSVKIVDSFNEQTDGNEENYFKDFTSKNNKYSFKSDYFFFSYDFEKQKIPLFIDGTVKQKIINHSNIHYFEDKNYKVENFTTKLFKIPKNMVELKISNKTFLYSGIDFLCNGAACGLNLNMIYDITRKKMFFIENYRFPFDNYFISDFNNDGTIDLMIISVKKEKYYCGNKINDSTYCPIEMRTLKLSWYEYSYGKFKIKKDRKNKPINLLIEEYTFCDYIKYKLIEDGWSKFLNPKK